MSLRNAFAYLTAVRVPPRTRVPLAMSVHYFPWIGAALGSLNILFFLAASRAFPAAVACGVAVLLPQVLAGFSPLRGVMEAAQGLRTIPGHGFAPGFRPDTRGVMLAASLAAAKWAALLALSPDWRVRAAFVFPILGMCVRTGAFLWDARVRRLGGRMAARRRVRAGFLSASLLFLAFLFPPAVGAALLAAGAFAGWLVLRVRWRGGEDARGGLTLQTAALASEVTEIAVLAVLATASVLAA